MKIQRTNRNRAYALLDVILAVAIFALVGTALIRSLYIVQENSARSRFDRLVQYGLESVLTEAKHRPVKEMTAEIVDEVMGVTYTTTVETLEAANVDGNGLRDLYVLKATALFLEDGVEQEEVAEIYVYQPERR